MCRKRTKSSASLAVEVLVAGLQVDGRVGVAAGRVVVEVPAVDVHVDAVEAVDDVPEGAEVDRDHVVDRDPGQLLHGRQRAARAAVGVGLVDAARPRRVALAAGVRHDEVAREGQHRDRVLLRIDAHEHDRVGAGAGRGVAGAHVVADHDGHRRLVRAACLGELLDGRPHLGRGRVDRGDAVVEVELDAAGEPARRDEDERHQPDDALDEELERVPPGAVERALRRRPGRGRRRWRRGLDLRLGRRPVEEGQRARRVGAVPVRRPRSAFLQGRTHRGGAPAGDAMRIPKLTAVPAGSTRP